MLCGMDLLGQRACPPLPPPTLLVLSPPTPLLQCTEPWMSAHNYCAATCGRCQAGGVESGEDSRGGSLRGSIACCAARGAACLRCVPACLPAC